MYTHTTAERGRDFTFLICRYVIYKYNDKHVINIYKYKIQRLEKLNGDK